MLELVPSVHSIQHRTEHPPSTAPVSEQRRALVVRRAWVEMTTCAFVVLLLASGCASRVSPDTVCAKHEVSMKQEVYQRLETERAARLAHQVEQLSADLTEAENALVRAESGMRGLLTRADAVSSLAEARIQVERVASVAPWRAAMVAKARAKLEDAGKQIESGHFGAAIFFVYRAQRLADELEREAAHVYDTPGTRFVRGGRVNLRAGPGTSEPVLSILSEGTPVFPESHHRPWVLVRTANGAVGWVHGSLLSLK